MVYVFVAVTELERTVVPENRAISVKAILAPNYAGYGADCQVGVTFNVSPTAKLTVEASLNGAYQRTVVPEPEAWPTVALVAIKIPLIPVQAEPLLLVMEMADP
jgi:hypothetical protein